MEKMFSSSPQDPEVTNDPPPPYVLPSDFVEAGIKENELEVLKDYDTVIIVDDSGSMEPLWGQVQHSLSSPSVELNVDSCCVLILGVQGIGYARGGRFQIRYERNRHQFPQSRRGGKTPQGKAVHSAVLLSPYR